MSLVNLGRYDNTWYAPGRSRAVQALWFFFGLPILRSAWIPSSGLRVKVLRLFGAQIGSDVVIKPGTRVKYPWLLNIGDNTWVGEDVWIDNLVLVQLGSNVCISQGAYLCTGNHDWSDPAFSLIVKSIVVGSGAWIGARAILCPGIEVGEGAVVSAGSVATKDIEPYTICTGNPAVRVKARLFKTVVVTGSELLLEGRRS